jgi:hypothetical protein
VGYNRVLIKVDWLAACIVLRMVGAELVIYSGVGVKFAQSSSQWEPRADTRKKSANRKPGSVPEEISQTLLTNKKQGKKNTDTPLPLLNHLYVSGGNPVPLM